uniref:heparinase II/III domain-containing protein n=1 Tax=Aliivibrio sp. SR45-2 TaxID=2760931 RepID=UPI0015FC48BA
FLSNGKEKYRNDFKIRVFSNEKYLSQEDIMLILNSGHIKIFHSFFKIDIDSGYDVKFDWEIGRLNFLIAYAINDSNMDKQLVLDLLKTEALKSTGFGVQWKCAMDVALRVINVSLINDFYSDKYKINVIYNEFIVNSIDYIVLNLEKYGSWRGNHYLTNLVGILVVCAHIDSNKYNKMFDFALAELLIELDRQFLSDGTNFEGSTAYHHFGLELLSVVHTVLMKIDYSARKQHYKSPYLLTNLGIKKCVYDISLFTNIIAKLKSKILKGLEFSIASLDSRGRLIQIGDNDSGKVFRTCYTECHNPEFYADIVYQINESLRTGKFPCRVESEQFYINYVEALRKNKTTNQESFKDTGFETAYLKANKVSKRLYTFEIKDIRFPTSLEYFEDFGLVVARSKDSVFTFRCGAIGQLGKGGHDHYDQLSITLNDSGERVIADPGVGCYTRDTSIRNRYRSSKAHFGLISKGEVDDYSNVFSINSTPSTLLTLHDNKILGKQVVNNVEKYRSIEFEQGRVIIKDLVINGEILEQYEKIPYSPGYGIIENE